jgi:tetratricopeptide (TPR) repeat protein
MMKRLVILILAVVGLLSVQIGSAVAEEELFDTKAASALFDKGMEHLRAMKLNEAIQDFEESLSFAPEARTYYFLGYTYYLKGKTGDAESRKQAIESFDKAYELDPTFTPNKSDLSVPEAPGEKTEPTGTSPAPDTGNPVSGASQTKDAVVTQQ